MDENDPKDIVEAFITASHDEVEKQREREAVRRKGVRAVLVLAVIAVILAVFALFSREAALRQMEQAQQQRSQAELRRTQAEDLIGFMLGDLKTKLDGVGRLDILEDVGRKAMDYFETLPEDQLTGDSLMKQVQALHRIGEVRYKQNNIRAALESFQQALVKAEALGARDPSNSDWQYELVVTYYWITEVYLIDKQPKPALPYCRKYLDVAQRMLQMKPEDDFWRFELSCALQNLAAIHTDLGLRQEALDFTDQNLAILEALLNDHPEDRSYQADFSDALTWKGRLLLTMGKQEEALQIFERALTIRKFLEAAEPENQRHHEFLRELYRLLMHTHNFGEEPNKALVHARSAHEISQALVRLDPSNQEWKYQLAMTWKDQGVLNGKLAKWKKAAVCFQEAETLGLSLGPNQAGRWRLLLADLKNARAEILLDRGDPRDVLRILNAKPLNSDETPEGLISRMTRLRHLGVAYSLLGEREKSQEYWMAGLEAFDAKIASQKLLQERALLLLFLGRTEEAQPLLKSFKETGFKEASFWREVQRSSQL